MGDNKGFTLVELLTVIVILFSISLIIVSGITASLEKRSERECQEQIQLAKNQAKIYFSLNNVTSVTVGTLKSNGYFSANSKTDKLSSGDIVTKTNSEYVFTGTGECK